MRKLLDEIHRRSLWQVLDASGRVEEAAEAYATYGELWADADEEIALPGG